MQNRSVKNRVDISSKESRLPPCEHNEAIHGLDDGLERNRREVHHLKWGNLLFEPLRAEPVVDLIVNNSEAH